MEAQQILAEENRIVAQSMRDGALASQAEVDRLQVSVFPIESNC